MPPRISHFIGSQKHHLSRTSIDKAPTPPRASDGTTIDHLGFRTKDIKTELADLEAKGVKATGAPRQDPNVPTTFATFIEGATGRIEMTQR